LKLTKSAMIKFFISFLLLFSFITSAQTDHNGNPVFNSVVVKEEAIGDYTLVTSYYTLKNNIENKVSSVYIADKPSLDQIEQAALNLPSELYLIVKSQAAVAMIMPVYNQGNYFVMKPATEETNNYPSALKGQISEQRAKELVMNMYDPNAILAGNTLFFNDKKFTVISPTESKKELLQLIGTYKISSGQPGSDSPKILSQEETKALILTESKEGGKLDFFTEIKGHEFDAVQVKPGVFSTKLSMALYGWGMANFELGTNTVADALEWWALHKGRPANQREVQYITMGFNKELEK